MIFVAKSTKTKLKVTPLGGINEIGKNMTVYEYGSDMILMDCGSTFPEDDMPGVDLVIPDTSYLVKNKDKLKGIVLTHGHEDHIGALPYVLKEINVPVYGTRMTLGLVENKLKEFGLSTSVKLVHVEAGSKIQLGAFEIELINVNHSIAGTVSLAIRCPVGLIVHTGDFKVDYTPIDGEVIDLGRFAQLGQEGVLAMFADSTNVERPGYTMSESVVGETFDRIFGDATGRIIVASFASNVHRIQQAINSALTFDRKIVISGRSMVNVVNVATELGYLSVPDGAIIDVDKMNSFPPERILILTTGSQGEPMSALARMAVSEHKKIEIMPGDLIIISAMPIPGNEKMIHRVINELFKKGADVIYESLDEIHVSGHACQEELKLIHKLVRPKYFIPVHGEYRHLKRHAMLAESLGMPPENIFIPDVGVTMEFSETSCKVAGSVPAGSVLVDGLGVGDVGNIVLRDRKHLSQDGLMVVVVTIDKETGTSIAGPDIISRGFVYVRESEALMEQAKVVVKGVLEECRNGKVKEWTTIKSNIRDELKKFLYEKTKRNPMILPVIMEV
ncbi:MAG: ribonuclease [Clostridiales bacterium]|nr:ribonuclease [Clostridiales bacterium]MDK2992582.1 ribonuclease [Clostridiales bacterium]